MSDTHGTNDHDQQGSAHAAGDHPAGHGNGHDAHDGGAALGPIDWTMWGAGLVGVIAALIVVAGFVAATDFSFVA